MHIMRLEAHLEKQRAAIIERWFDKVLETYPADSSQFLGRQKDPFANPVGNTTHKALESVFHLLLTDMDHEALVSALDPMIRIRAVQDFSPSRATGFIFFLKEIIRDQVKDDLEDIQKAKALLQFELKIDRLNLIAFDIYMACRETVYQIKADHEKKSTYRAFERAGLLADEENT